MQDSEKPSPTASMRTPWNKGKLTGAKPPLQPKHVWSKQAGFVVLHLSELSRLRANVKSALDLLSDEISEKGEA